MVILIGVILFIILMMINIYALVNFIRNFRFIKVYLKYGLMVGVTILIVGTIASIITMIAFDPTHPNAVLPEITLISQITALIVASSRIIGFTTLGIFICAVNGWPSLTFTIKKFQLNLKDENDSIIPAGFLGTQSTQRESETQAEIESPASAESIIPPNTDNLESGEKYRIYPEISTKHFLYSTVGVAIFAIAFSILLFIITKPTMSETFKSMLEATFPDYTGDNMFWVAILGIFAAFEEELIFRLGIQNILVRIFNFADDEYWKAILITTVIWTIGHYGALNPQWVKMVQIFPIGLMLGWLQKNYGTESCIVAHTVMNLVLIPFTPMLIK